VTKKQLRVAYLLRYLPSPSETFVLDEAMALQEAGVGVRPWVLDRVPAAVRHARHEPLYAKAAIVPRPSSPRAVLAAFAMEEHPAFTAVRVAWGTAGRRRDLRRVAWLARRWRSLQVDVIRVHHAAETARVAVSAGAMAGIPVSIAVHARDLFVPVEDFPWIVRNADLVTTITPFHRDRLLRSGLPSERVALVRCAVDLPSRTALPPEPGSFLRLLAVGRLVRKKGHDLLMGACAELAAEGTPIELTIVGDGREGLALRNLAAQLMGRCPELSIEMLGPQPVEAVEELMEHGRFHAAALACRVAEDGDRDGVPVSLLEAQARGLPVVTSALPGFEYELVQEEGAILIPTQEYSGVHEPVRQNLVRAIAELYRDREYQASMAVAARRTAERRPSPQEIGRDLARLLQGVCSSIPPSVPGRSSAEARSPSPPKSES